MAISATLSYHYCLLVDGPKVGQIVTVHQHEFAWKVTAIDLFANKSQDKMTYSVVAYRIYQFVQPGAGRFKIGVSEDISYTAEDIEAAILASGLKPFAFEPHTEYLTLQTLGSKTDHYLKLPQASYLQPAEGYGFPD